MSRKSARRQYDFERRAFVGIACALVVLHAFLAALASAGSVPRAPADAVFTICHAGGSADEAPAGDKAHPNALCGLCAHGIAGAALPPGDVIGPVAAADIAIGAGKLAPIRIATVPPREGRPRAPPTMV